jgi:hypothetical protein
LPSCCGRNRGSRRRTRAPAAEPASPIARRAAAQIRHRRARSRCHGVFGITFRPRPTPSRTSCRRSAARRELLAVDLSGQVRLQLGDAGRAWSRAPPSELFLRLRDRGRYRILDLRQNSSFEGFSRTSLLPALDVRGEGTFSSRTRPGAMRSAAPPELARPGPTEPKRSVSPVMTLRGIARLPPVARKCDRRARFYRRRYPYATRGAGPFRTTCRGRREPRSGRVRGMKLREPTVPRRRPPVLALLHFRPSPAACAKTSAPT